jgi:hypothetical protein
MENSEITLKSSSLLTSRFLPSMLMIGAGGLLITFSQTIKTGMSPSQDDLNFYMAIGGMLLIIIGAAASSISYLAGGLKVKSSVPDQSYTKLQNTLSEFESRIEEIQDNFASIIGEVATERVSLSEEDREQLSRNIKQQFSENISDEIITNIVEKLGTQDLSSSSKNIRLHFSQTKERLFSEVESLTRRGNLNLVIGGITTVFAVGMLVYIVLNGKIPISPEQRNIEFLLWHYVPRLSVAIFIEVFSFFFLKLYRNSLEDIKFFQNEITNIDSKIISLEAAIFFKDKNTISAVVSELSKTERNFKLQKGESTVGLEQSKIESQGINNFVANVTSILQKSK